MLKTHEKLHDCHASVVRNHWRDSIASSLRENMVRKIVRAIWLAPFAVESYDLYAYAKRKRKKYQEKAKSRSEYYNWLTSKSEQIKNERHSKLLLCQNSDINLTEEYAEFMTKDRLQMYVSLRAIDINIQESKVKNGQRFISSRQRGKFVKGIVRVMIPMSEPTEGMDERINCMIRCAKEIELYAFKVANSVAKYIRIYLEKVYALKIHLLDRIDGVNEELIQQPDCVAARKLINHFKEESLRNCKQCRRMMVNKYQRFAPRYFIRKQERKHSALLKLACRCQDRLCKNPMCLKMKRAIAHTNGCRNKDPYALLCQEMATFFMDHMAVCTQKDCILIMKCGLS